MLVSNKRNKQSIFRKITSGEAMISFISVQRHVNYCYKAYLSQPRVKTVFKTSSPKGNNRSPESQQVIKIF